MRSRKDQYTITCREVHDRAAAAVQQHVKIEDQGHVCRAAVLLNVLLFAASRISSVFAACRNLADALSQQAVFNALVATLPEYRELEKRLNAALVDGLPKALRRRPQTLAIDLTLIPYHGRPQNHPDEIYRSQPKCGTSHFHAYATCYVIRMGHPGSTRWVRETYRTRFGIETSYRQMNEARIGVGIAAAGIATAAYYAALDYCRERRQGRPLSAKDPALPQIPIVEHADIKRMLLFQRAVVEGSLSLLFYSGPAL